MSSPSTRARFDSTAVWPFSLRTAELTKCRKFLVNQELGPRILRIFGASGTGKSFLARELMVQSAKDGKNGLGIYLDVPPADLEASAFFDMLDLLLSARRDTSRDAPSFVDRKAAQSWISAKSGRSARRVSYVYSAFRELVAQIPLLGPFIKALLPRSVPVTTAINDSSAPLRFLIRSSKSRNVILAIDNVQFLPFAVRETVAAELAAAGPHLRLVLIERLRGRSRLDWAPHVPQSTMMDIDLDNASLEEVATIVGEVLPEAEDAHDLASIIFRRSEGNLKSVWYQLRLIASRRHDQEALPGSYEDVILTLSPPYQAVLRFIVFTVGGLTLANLVALLHATNLPLRPDAVTNAIGDLAALGLLVINSTSADRVRVEHELVAHVVSDITPEEEKLELHEQALLALSAVLDRGVTPTDEAVLYDRLLGIVTDVELRQTPSLLSHLVRFVQIQAELERHEYLASICRDSVCWDVLDTLPETTVRSLLDAIQKSALFSFGLVAAERLSKSASSHQSLAALYEAKYLVQLYRHEEATAALQRVADSKEKRAVAFNIILNLAQDDRAADIAMAVYKELTGEIGAEHDYLILRNSAHLFPPDDARTVVEASVNGFEALGRRFGVATALDNLGIIELSAGSIDLARERFDASRRQLTALDSPEIYQPLVNLSAVSLLSGDIEKAEHLLSLAQDAAPRSLLQDSAMLHMNAIALEVCRGRHMRRDVVDRMDMVVVAARKTRDLRFVDIVKWFAECLQAALAGRDRVTTPAHQRIDEIRANGRVALEVFVQRQLGNNRLDVPFMLSPHWRY